jgi:hypothetical protein
LSRNDRRQPSARGVKNSQVDFTKDECIAVLST